MKKTPQELFSLQGKVALVIGGTGELCGAMAEGLAAAGARVLLVGRNPEKAQARMAAIREAGGQADFLAADIRSREAVEGLLAQALDLAGQIDILVNGAGINSPTPFFEVSEMELDAIMEVNFRSVFLTCQVFGRYMVERGEGGSVINIGSMSGATVAGLYLQRKQGRHP